MAAGAGDEGRGRGAGLSLPAPTNGRGAPPLATIAAISFGRCRHRRSPRSEEEEARERGPGSPARRAPPRPLAVTSRLPSSPLASATPLARVPGRPGTPRRGCGDGGGQGRGRGRSRPRTRDLRFPRSQRSSSRSLGQRSEVGGCGELAANGREPAKARDQGNRLPRFSGGIARENRSTDHSDCMRSFVHFAVRGGAQADITKDVFLKSTRHNMYTVGDVSTVTFSTEDISQPCSIKTA
ncbi:unnamed protein product [Lampetra fluviatilis]